MLDSLKRLPAFNSSSSLSKGVLYELYLLFEIELLVFVVYLSLCQFCSPMLVYTIT